MGKILNFIKNKINLKVLEKLEMEQKIMLFFQLMLTIHNIIQIEQSDHSTCVLENDYKVYCWGYNM